MLPSLSWVTTPKYTQKHDVCIYIHTYVNANTYEMCKYGFESLASGHFWIVLSLRYSLKINSKIIPVSRSRFNTQKPITSGSGDLNS